MGTVIKKSEAISQQSFRLCIDCSGTPSPDAFSINQPLAAALLKLRPRMRSLQMEKCLLQILQALPDHAVICDIDVMFNPSYAIDVMTTLISVYKQKAFSLVWPGYLQNGNLVYSEEGYADYKIYSIDDYDIICAY